MSEAKIAAQKARQASTRLALLDEGARNAILHAMAASLRENIPAILEANAADMDAARAKGTSESLLDRLMLDEGRIESMAQALEALASLPDPTGKVLEERTLYNGLNLRRVTVPLGVVAMVYEARPNVTVDAAGICLKSGNAAVLRGGSLAHHSNVTLTHLLHDAAVDAGAPENCIVAIESTDRSETDELLGLRGLIDVLIPRGGAGLINRCVELAKVPVIETGVGNCHLYVEATGDQEMAIPIMLNAKTQRPGVCNAIESLLVDEAIAEEFLPVALSALDAAGVAIHGDETTARIGQGIGVAVIPATDEDWGREYLGMEISVHVVSGPDEAIAHVNRYGTNHSEAIITRDAVIAERFQREVDAAAVYVNASTRFTDGGEFGLGAEIGISTQKTHVRGPFALEALTTYKYLITGEGQVRG